MGNAMDAKQWAVRNAIFAKTCQGMEAMGSVEDPVLIEGALT